MNGDNASIRARTGDPAGTEPVGVELALPEDGPSAEPLSSPAPWWRIADFGVLAVWIVIVSFTLRYHEKWADEAQAWLLARDLDLKTLWFKELRYEGSPGLWHTILWVAQHGFHARYDSIGFIGAVCALAGVAALLFLSPFPRPIRWLMALSYFFVYQYAVIARSYVLFPLFCLLAARQIRDQKHPQLLALALVPLALVTSHGSLLAAGLGLAYAVRFIKQWHEHDRKTRARFVASTGALALLYLLLFLVLLPAPDVEVAHNDKLTAAVITHRGLTCISGTLVDNQWMSLAVLLVFGAWCYSRRALTSFVLPVALMVALYVYADGWPHQQGTIFFAVITGLAIAWPERKELQQFDVRNLWAYRVMLGVLAATLAYQVYVASVIIRNDVNLPYSGDEDAARFLKPIVAQGKVIWGYQYGMVGINAYFDHNIFANRPRAYYHHSISEFAPRQFFEQMRTATADYVVTNWWDPWDENEFRERLLAPMAAWGYSLVHSSDGYLLTKTGYTHRQIYFVFKRSSPPSGQMLLQPGPGRPD